MRIVSLNAWGGARFDALSSWLPSMGADVVCLQEVTRTPFLEGWTTFEDADRRLPQRASLFDDVRLLLPDHQAFFVASDAGPVSDGAGAVHRQDFGLAIFVDARCPVVGQLSDFIHGEFVDHLEWRTKERPRIAQGLRVIDREAARTVSILHAHGLRDPAGKHDTPARHEQAHRLAHLSATLRRTGDLSIVCGDLNLLPSSDTFRALAEVGLTDLVGDADTRTSSYAKPGRSANYLLTSNVDAVKRFDIPAMPEVSDHRPLILDI